MKRKQNRLPNQLRAMEAQLGLLTNADGSAKYKQGESSVLAAVYGPAEVRTREELGDRATVNVVFKRREGKPGRQEKEFEKLLRISLESIIMTHLHPRTAITIIVQVLVDDGSILSVALNACMLALMDAGIPLVSTLSAVTCGVIDDDGSRILFIDPDSAEDKKCTGITYFVFDTQVLARSDEGGLVSSNTVGLLSDQELQSCQTACRSGAKSVSAFIRITLSRKPTTVLADEEPVQLEKEIDASTSTSTEDLKKEPTPTNKSKKIVSGAFMKPI